MPDRISQPRSAQAGLLIARHPAQRPRQNVGKDDVERRRAAHLPRMIAMGVDGTQAARGNPVDAAIFGRRAHRHRVIVSRHKTGRGTRPQRGQRQNGRPASHIEAAWAPQPAATQDILQRAKTALGRRVRSRPEGLRRLDLDRPACRRRSRLDMIAENPEPANAARRKGGTILGKPVPVGQPVNHHRFRRMDAGGKTGGQQFIDNHAVGHRREHRLDHPGTVTISQMRRRYRVEKFGEHHLEAADLAGGQTLVKLQSGGVEAGHLGASRFADESGHHFLVTGLVEGDFKLVTIDMDHISHAEFLVEDTVTGNKPFILAGRQEMILFGLALLRTHLARRHPAPAGPIAASRRIAKGTATGKLGRRGAAKRNATAKPLRDILNHCLGGQFLDKARGDRTLPLAMDPPAAGKAQENPLAGAGDADIGKAAFLLQPDRAVLVDRALAREDALFPPGQEDSVEFQTFRRMESSSASPRPVRSRNRHP